MLAMVVGDDVRMTQRAEDVELGSQLLSFLLGHFDVVDFLSTENLECLVVSHREVSRMRGFLY